MGVAFYEKENIMNNNNNLNTTPAAEEATTSCNCNTCNPQPETNTTSTQTSTLNFNLNKSGFFKEIIGNFKEVRIDENYHNLRIVGNNNRIRIANNKGDLFVIGNNTKLKIERNHGQIKYTGNDGRICLGEDSPEQLVDYSGCNGVLKVINSKSSQNKNNNCAAAAAAAASSNEFKSSAMESTRTLINKQFIGIQTANTTATKCHEKSNRKSASYGGSSSCSNISNNTSKCEFNLDNIFKRKKSMPNITSSTTSSTSGKTNIIGPSSIVQHIGNIVITNSANVCITPFT